MKIVIYFLILLNSLTFVAKAVGQDLCAPTATAVYFGNGVGRGVQTFGDAGDGLRSLQIVVTGAVDPANQDNYDFKLAFNSSSGRLNDIIETARQTFGNEWPMLLTAFLLRDTLILSLLPDDVVQQFNDFLTNSAIQEMVNGNASNADVANQVSSYKSDIGEGKKVVLVAHSQGNIFANLAFQRLSSGEAQYFTIVPAASPESFVRKSLVGYVRFEDDLVIAGVEAAKLLVGLSAPLAANDEDNVNSPWPWVSNSDFLSHGFQEAYLADDSARQFIINGVLTSEEMLPDPPMSSGQGTITVTLTWGSNPDVDLHTYEPTGTHVYYASRYGQFGYLDVDDVTGYGPEHYYVSCQTLRDNPSAIGRYRFGVNYYHGYSPEVATVTVKTPSAESTYSRTLSSARGSSGDNSMVPMADVVVSRNPDTGRFDFAIESR